MRITATPCGWFRDVAIFLEVNGNVNRRGANYMIKKLGESSLLH